MDESYVFPLFSKGPISVKIVDLEDEIISTVNLFNREYTDQEETELKRNFEFIQQVFDITNNKTNIKWNKRILIGELKVGKKKKKSNKLKEILSKKKKPRKRSKRRSKKQN